MEYISPDEWAKQLGIGRSKAMQLLHDGQVPGAFKLGKQWRIPKDSIPGVSVSKAGSDQDKARTRVDRKRLALEEKDLDKEIAIVENDLKDIENVRKIKADHDKRQAELETWNEQLEGLQSTLDQRDNELAELKKELSSKQATLTKRANAVEQAKEKAYADIQERNTKLKTSEAAFKVKQDALKDDKAAFEAAKKEYNQEVKAHRLKMEQEAVEVAAVLKYLMEIKTNYELNHDEKRVFEVVKGILESGIKLPKKNTTKQR